MIPTTDAIDVVWLDLNATPSEVEGLKTLLSLAEEQRASNFNSATLRRRAIVRMARRRQVLANVCDTNPRDIVFEFSALGKPSIARGAGLELGFSLSHCGDVGMIAFVLDRTIGVDVDTVSELPETFQFLDLVASDHEKKEIDLLPQSERPAAALTLWTRKEALLKATGQGIGEGLKHITVPIESDAQGLTFQPVSNGPSWLLYELKCPRPELSGALVASEDDGRPTPNIVTSYL
jgi:4'-phosphopantetheinyl transferase